MQAAARVSDPRLATIYDTDYGIEGPYIVSEWTRGTHLEDLVLSGLPSPALAAAMIADAADALAVAHRAGRPHLCLGPRSLRWDTGSGLKITGLGIDAALSGTDAAGRADGRGRHHSPGPDALRPAHRLLARRRADRAAGRPEAQGTRVHPAAGPGRRARRAGRDHLPRPAAPAAGRATAGAHPGGAGHGAALGVAALVLVVPPGRAGGCAPVLAQDTMSRRQARHARNPRVRAGIRHRTTLLRPAA